MPNWANNMLIVKGKTEDVEEFDADFHGFPFITKSEKNKEEEIQKKRCFNSLVPQPSEEEIREMYNDGTEESKFEKLLSPIRKWRINNWGTKWDIYNKDDILFKVEEAGDEVIYKYRFDTAWSPPSSFVMKVSHDYPNSLFTLKTFELGMFFMIKDTFDGGAMVDSIHAGNMESMKNNFKDDDFLGSAVKDLILQEKEKEEYVESLLLSEEEREQLKNN